MDYKIRVTPFSNLAGGRMCKGFIVKSLDEISAHAQAHPNWYYTIELFGPPRPGNHSGTHIAYWFFVR